MNITISSNAKSNGIYCTNGNLSVVDNGSNNFISGSKNSDNSIGISLNSEETKTVSINGKTIQ